MDNLCHQIIKDVVDRMTWSELTLLGCEIHKKKNQKCDENFIIWKKKLYEMTPSINWECQLINRFDINCGSTELHTNLNHSIYVEIINKPKLVDGVEMWGICPEGSFQRLSFRVEFNSKGETESICSEIKKDVTQKEISIDESLIIHEIKKYIDFLKIEFPKYYWFKNDPTNEIEGGNLKDKTLCRTVGHYSVFVKM